MPLPENRRRISDVATLRALANPLRYRLLRQLLEVGPRTASECADVVGGTPSNCSYHLRELARFGLVERDDSEPVDGRERPWRATNTGLSYGAPGDVDPAALAARRVIGHAGIDDSARLAHVAVDRLAETTESGAWREASTFSTYGLRVTADELAAIVKAIDGVVRPYLAPTRIDAPDDAEVVRITLQAFRHPEAP